MIFSLIPVHFSAEVTTITNANASVRKAFDLNSLKEKWFIPFEFSTTHIWLEVRRVNT